jgi:UDP-N-acetylglucosamine--N-acetylmuramyl-(pentapeptide) pyrophosphoryl-undecaprenol N-acetylglucosamine transferase
MDVKKQPRILIAAGGTGGHVFPALAIADELKKLNPLAVFLFVGTKDKIEARIVPQRGYSFTTIWVSGFHRSLRVSNVLFPLKVIVSIVQSFFLIIKFHPDVVIGTGGYACGPVLYLASLFRIPTVVHESNSYPGVTTRMLSNRVTKLFTAFEATSRWLKRSDNIEVVGTPTRESLAAVSQEDGLKFFGLDRKKKTVLVFGGSLGATSINQAIQAMVDELAQSGVQLIWQTGKYNAAIAEMMKQKRIGGVYPFIDAMENAYAAADVVVCRAGATTLAEITRLGKAAILVPYPYAAADHQTVNARTLAEAGAAVMIADRELGLRLKQELCSLLNDDVRRLVLSEACRKFGKPDAGSNIAKKIMALIG